MIVQSIILFIFHAIQFPVVQDFLNQFPIFVGPPVTYFEIYRPFFIIQGIYTAVLCIVYLISDIGVGLVTTTWIVTEFLVANHLGTKYGDVEIGGLNQF